MSQEKRLISAGNDFTAKNVSVSCPATGNTTLLVLNVVDITRLFVQVSTITQALDAFTISAKAHPDLPAVTIASTAANYTSPADPIVNASSDLTSLSVATGSGWVIINTLGMYEVTITCSAAVDSAVVTIGACGQ